MFSVKNCREDRRRAAAVKKRAGDAIAQRLRSLKGDEIFRGDYPQYTNSPEENLVPGVTKIDFWKDHEEGNGRELSESRKPATSGRSSLHLTETPRIP